MKFDPKNVGSLLSYYCSDCGEHINALDDSTYVQITVCNANPGVQSVNPSGRAQLLLDIMSRPVPSAFFCLDCAHEKLVGPLELHP